MQVVETEGLVIEILPEEIRDAPGVFDAIGDAVNRILSSLWSYLYSFYYRYIYPAIQRIKDAVVSAVQRVIDPIKRTVNSLSRLFEKIMDDLWAVVRYPLEWIRNAIQSLANIVRSTIDRLKYGIETVIRSVIGGLRNAITTVWNAIKSAVLTIGGWIKGGLERLYNAISNVLRIVGEKIWGVIERLRGALEGIWNRIIGFFRSIGEGIWNTFNNVWNTLVGIRDGLVNWFRNLWNTLTTGFARIGDFLSKVKDAIVSFFKDPVGTIVRGFQKYVWPTLQWIYEKARGFVVWVADRTKDIITSIWETLMNIFSGVATFFTNVVLRPVLERIAYGRGSPGWVDVIVRPVEAVGGLFTRAIRGMIEYPYPPSAEKAWESAKKFVGFSFLMGLMMAISDRIEELIGDVLSKLGLVFGGARGRRRGPSFLTRVLQTTYWAIGIGWLTWMTFGPMLRATIGEPLSRFYRQKYRTEEPTRSMVEEWARSRYITYDQFRELMGYLGYPDKYIPVMYQSVFRLPTLSMLEDFYMYGLIDDDRLLMYVRKLGYSDSDAIWITERIKRKAIYEYARRYVTNIAKQYRKGYLTYEDAYNRLTSIGIHPIRAAWILVAEDVERNTEVIDLRVKTLIEKFMDWTIDEDTLRDQLSDYIADPELLDAIVEYALARRNPRQRPRPREALVKRLSRLEFRLKSLQAQHRRLIVRRKETEDVYLARLRYYDRLKKEIENYYNTLIELLKKEMEAEYKAWVDKTTKQIEARIALLRKRLQANVKRKMETLRAFEIRRKEELDARILRETHEIVDTLRELKREWLELADKVPPEFKTEYDSITEEIERVISTPTPDYVADLLERILTFFIVTGIEMSRTMDRLIDRIEDRLIRIKVLQIMSKARIEERRRRVEEDIARQTDITEAKIEALERMKEVAIEYRRGVMEAVLNRRIGKLEAYKRMKIATYEERMRVVREEMDRVLKDFEERIKALEIKIDFTRSELEGVKEALRQYYGAAM